MTQLSNNHLSESTYGYTLVELLMFIGLFSILLSVLTTIFFSTLELRARTEITTTVEQDSRYVLQKLTQVVRDADSVILPLANGNSSSQLIISRGGSTETYQIQNAKLVQIVGTDSFQLNASTTNIDSFSVQKLGNISGSSTVKISLTLSSTGAVAATHYSQTITTTIGIR